MEYFDIQVNGYGGIDFNQDDLTPGDLHRVCERLTADGVEGILATIITDFPERMISRLRRIAKLRDSNDFARQVIAGFHIEGPFLNPKDGCRGAHPQDAIQPADLGLAERLLDAGSGLVRIFTLAPEQDPGSHITRFLSNQHIVVSAGHTDASLDQLREGIDAGLSMVTHLGNACPKPIDRHENIIQRALFLRKHLWLSFIADGVHIPFPALRNYLDLAGDRSLVTTDAMAAAGLGAGTHRLGRWTVEVKEDLAAWAPDGSHLLGSAMSMPRVAQNLAKKLGLDGETIALLTSKRPREAIGLQ